MATSTNAKKRPASSGAKPAGKSSGGDKKAIKKYVTPVFRLSFPHLFVATSMEEGQAKKYQTQAIWDPASFNDNDKKRWSIILKAMDTACMETFGKPWKTLRQNSNFKAGIRNGAEKEDLAGYGEGTRFATLSSTKKPGVIDRNENTISPDEGNEEEIYPGCFCRAVVTVYAYNKGGGKGVALGLRSLQKLKDGERLDSSSNAQEDFDGEDIDEEWMQEDFDDSGDGDDSDGDDSDFD